MFCPCRAHRMDDILTKSWPQIPHWGRTHSRLLHHTCGDEPLLVQLCKRFIKRFFFCGAFRSKNNTVSRCAQLALRSSNSHVSNTLNYIEHFYNVDNFDIVESSESLYISSNFEKWRDWCKDYMFYPRSTWRAMVYIYVYSIYNTPKWKVCICRIIIILHVTQPISTISPFTSIFPYDHPSSHQVYSYHQFTVDYPALCEGVSLPGFFPNLTRLYKFYVY